MGGGRRRQRGEVGKAGMVGRSGSWKGEGGPREEIGKEGT